MKILKILGITLLSTIISMSVNAEDSIDSDLCTTLADLSGTAMYFRQSDRSLIENFALVEEVNKENLFGKVPGSYDYELTKKINTYFEIALKNAYYYPFYDIPEIDLKIKNNFIRDNYISCMPQKVIV